MDLELLAICGVALTCAVARLVQRRRSPMRIDKEGLIVSGSVRVRLEDVESFGVASVSEIEGGLYQPVFTQLVGVRLNDSSPLKSTRACADNRRLSDYDVLLTPDRGRKVEEFAAYLEEEKRKFVKS